MKHLKIFMMGALWFFIFCSKQEEQKQNITGKILYLEGMVTINEKPAQQDQILNWNDKIITGEKSKVRFVIQQGLIIQLNQNSEFSLSFSENTYKLNLEKGWIAAVKNPDKTQMEVITPTAVASVRGTSLCFKVESKESVYGCTCNGTLHWHTKDGQTLEVGSQHHSARRFIQEKDKILIKEAGLEFHNDEIIEELAKQIHHDLKWK